MAPDPARGSAEQFRSKDERDKHLQKEIKETEQAELTDTDCDNDNTDTDTNDTRSDVGTVSDVSSKYETLLENLSWAEQVTE